MALTFVCQACGTVNQATDVAGLPTTKCSKCWSPNLKPEGMPDAAPGSGASASSSGVPAELLDLFERLFNQVEARRLGENERAAERDARSAELERQAFERQASLDEAENKRRELVANATDEALVSFAKLCEAGALFLKSLTKVG